MKVKIAATQMSCDWEIENNLNKAIKLVETAAQKGANIILLQELFLTPYFCIQYDEEIFKLAQTFEDSTLLKTMSDVAKKNNVVLPISFLYLLSLGFTATAISPNKVSGRVVATVRWPELCSYLMFQMKELSSSLETSRSDNAVCKEGSQLTSLYPL